jgi:hypothetical protein
MWSRVVSELVFRDVLVPVGPSQVLGSPIDLGPRPTGLGRSLSQDVVNERGDGALLGTCEFGRRQSRVQRVGWLGRRRICRLVASQLHEAAVVEAQCVGESKDDLRRRFGHLGAFQLLKVCRRDSRLFGDVSKGPSIGRSG